jgi:hypothetical protein
MSCMPVLAVVPVLRFLWSVAGISAKAITPAKRMVPDASGDGNEDVMSVAQTEVLMCRKVFESPLKAEEAQACKVETLKRKKMALAK